MYGIVRNEMETAEALEVAAIIVRSRINQLSDMVESLQNQGYFKQVIEIKPLEEDEKNYRTKFLKSRVKKLKEVVKLLEEIKEA